MRELRMYGVVSWLNAADRVSRTRRPEQVVTVVFVFKSCVVIVAHDVNRDTKKTKVTVSL